MCPGPDPDCGASCEPDQQALALAEAAKTAQGKWGYDGTALAHPPAARGHVHWGPRVLDSAAVHVPKLVG